MKTRLATYLKQKQADSTRKLVNQLTTSGQVHAYFPVDVLPVLITHILDGMQEILQAEPDHPVQLSLDLFFAKYASLIENNRELQLIILTIKHTIKSDVSDLATSIVELQELDTIIDSIFDSSGLHVLDLCSHNNNRDTVEVTENESRLPSRLNLFYNAFQGSTDGIIITDLEARIIEANDAFLEIYGYTYDEIIGKRTSILRSEKTTEGLYTKMWKEIRTSGSWAGQIINRHKNGQEFPVWLSITSVNERGKTVGYMGVEFDMRKQQELEKRVIQSERLAIIGQMAAKVAHEVRNPLSSISLNAELLGDELRSASEGISSEGETLLKAIMDEVERVTNLTEDYLQFSRLPDAEFHLVYLDELLADTVDFIEAEANSQGIQIIKEIEDDLPRVAADFHQIRRVIMNLMRNAFDAMSNGGLLRLHAVAAGSNVEISIADSGDGIPDAQKSKIFEPFYTTKDMGTGLGLAIARQIIQEHNGRISFSSRENAGTVFTIVLPIEHKSIHQREEEMQQ